MRTRVLLGAAAATALLAAAPVTAAMAAPAHDVLTIGKVGGTNVKTGATLKSGLEAKTHATFYEPESTTGVSCAKSSVTSTVSKNPAKPGTAAESVTALTFGKCTENIVSGGTVKSVVANGLPYAATVSDASGDPVTVSAASLTVNATLPGVGSITCTYTDATVTGAASNKGSKVTFTNQMFTFSTGSSSCAAFASADFSATYGPVKDTSVSGSPRVFVN